MTAQASPAMAWADLDGPRWQQAVGRLVNAPRFANAIIVVIVANALTLGLGTFSSINHDAGGDLTTLDHVFLGVFTAELLLRLAAVGFQPQRFLRRGWNVFDVVAVGASFVPGLAGNASALRLARLLRVTRLLSVLPDVAILVDGLKRALRPLVGLVLITGFLMYVYGIVGVTLFGKGDPEHWGNLGTAYLTLFQLLTMDQWPDILHSAQAASPWAVTYIISYVLIGGLIMIELLIGVVITSLEQAQHALREQKARRDQEAEAGAARAAVVLPTQTAPGHPDAAAAHQHASLAESIRVLREALEHLEAQASVG